MLCYACVKALDAIKLASTSGTDPMLCYACVKAQTGTDPMLCYACVKALDVIKLANQIGVNSRD